MLNNKATRAPVQQFMKNILPSQKRSVSGIVVTVILIALVMAVAAIVFTTTKKTVEEKIEKSEACGLGTMGKLSINSEYVCYDSINNQFEFSVNRGNIELDKLIIAVETGTKVKQFELKENEQNTDLIPFISGGSTALPAKNGGRTYISTGFNEEVIGIKIIPVINGKQCEIADSLNEITTC